MRSTTSSDSAVDLGQWLARDLLETPVKTAVREALAEEGVAPDEAAERPQDETTGALPVAGVIAGLVAVGVVAYLLRKRTGESEYPTRPSDVSESTAAADRVEGAVPVETDG